MKGIEQSDANVFSLTEVVTMKMYNGFKIALGEFVMNEQHSFVAVTGLHHHLGTQVFQLNHIVKFVKEPENSHDAEAIRVEIYPAIKVGYVANSTHTVPKGCRSAGRIYDTFGQYMQGVVRFILKDTVIVELAPNVEMSVPEKVNISDDSFVEI